MKMVHMVAFTLAMVGALNWGLIALLDFDIVQTVLGSMPAVAQLVYILIGVSAVYLFATHATDCKVCKS